MNLTPFRTDTDDALFGARALEHGAVPFVMLQGTNTGLDCDNVQVLGLAGLNALAEHVFLGNHRRDCDVVSEILIAECLQLFHHASFVLAAEH